MHGIADDRAGELSLRCIRHPFTKSTAAHI
jgi:hypothetical protein